MGDIFSNNKRRKLSHGWTCKDQRGEREAGKIQCYRNVKKVGSEESQKRPIYLRNKRTEKSCGFGSSFGDKKDLWETIFNSESGHGGLRSGDLGHWF